MKSHKIKNKFNDDLEVKRDEQIKSNNSLESLPEWVQIYDKKLMEDIKNNDKNLKLLPEAKEYLETAFQRTEKIRNDFYNNYLKDLEDKLNTQSSKDINNYENYFQKVSHKTNYNF